MDRRSITNKYQIRLMAILLFAITVAAQISVSAGSFAAPSPAPPMTFPPPPPKPDLIVRISAPSFAKVGTDIGPFVKVTARNVGNAVAKGTNPGGNGYMIDVVLSKDKIIPAGFAVFTPNFIEDHLLKGGRISNTFNLAPLALKSYPTGAGIPADTPPGLYYLFARIDPGNKVNESNEANNVAFVPIKIIP